MILTKEAQEAWLNEYAKNHTGQECLAFIDGINKVIEAFEKHENKK